MKTIASFDALREAIRSTSAGDLSIKPIIDRAGKGDRDAARHANAMSRNEQKEFNLGCSQKDGRAMLATNPPECRGLFVRWGPS
jgi:hypothetical protein